MNMKRGVYVLLIIAIGLLITAPVHAQNAEDTATAQMNFLFEGYVTVEFDSPDPEITFPGITLGSGTSESRAPLHWANIRIWGHTNGWTASLSTDGLISQVDSNYVITDITVDPTGFVFYTGPDSTSNIVVGFNTTITSGGVAFIRGNGPCRGISTYANNQNNLKVTVNDTDDVIAGEYQGDLVMTVQVDP